MSLFEKLKNKRYDLQEKKDEFDKIKKPTKKANKEVFDSTSRSANKDAKKYASGEYPKIGGGDRMTPKSKGSGASTGGTNTPPAIVGGKSKGTTPVKVNTTKPVKQSEVSKKAKDFTADINKKRTKRVFPGDKSGAYQRVKADIETKNLIKKAGGSGDIGFTAPNRKTKVAKRTTRAIKQGTPDPFFVDTSKAAKQTAKDFGIPTKSQIKKLDKKPGGYRAPAGNFGKGITQGQANALRMDKKAFVKTPYAEYDPIKQPRGVKIPGKSYKDFSKKLKTDVTKTSSSTPRTVTKKFTPTVGVKQAKVSKRAKSFTNQIAQQKKVKTDKVVDLATKKQQSKLSKAAKDITQQRDDAIVKREKLRSAKGVKDIKAIRATNRQVGQLDKLAQTTKKAASGVGNPLAPVKYNKMTAGADFIKNNRKPNTKLVTKPVTKKSISDLMTQNKIEKGLRVGPTGRLKRKGPVLLDDIPVQKNVPREIRFSKASSAVLKKTPKAIKPIARPALKLLAKAGTPGRIAAFGLGAAAISPAGRKALGQLATGTGLTALFGRGKKEKQLKVGDGLKNVGKVRVTADSRGLKRNQADMAKIKATQKNFIDKYNKGRTFGKIKYNVNKQGTYDVIKPKKK